MCLSAAYLTNVDQRWQRWLKVAQGLHCLPGVGFLSNDQIFREKLHSLTLHFRNTVELSTWGKYCRYFSSEARRQFGRSGFIIFQGGWPRKGGKDAIGGLQLPCISGRKSRTSLNLMVGKGISVVVMVNVKCSLFVGRKMLRWIQEKD